MGVFKRIWNLTLDSLNIQHEEESTPHRGYGVPPSEEDDLIHKYCTDQVNVEGREITGSVLSAEKYTYGQIKAAPEELNSLLSQYGSSEEKSIVRPLEVSPIKPDNVSVQLKKDTSTACGVSPARGGAASAPSDYKERVGAEFEEEVMSILEGVASIYGGEVYSSLVIPRDDSDANGQVNTSQLDALVALPTYIVVVECKNWEGTVYANYDKERNWVVVSSKGKSYQQYSPTRQNETHIRTLSKFLGVSPTHFASAVVFSNRGQLRKLPQATYHSFVGDGEQLARYIGILAMSGHTEVPYLELAKTKLRMLQRTSEHATEQQRVTMRTRRESNICPSCGHKLLIRKSRKTGNRFYGCSMYPQCKYTKDIT